MPKKVTVHKRSGNLKKQTRLPGFLQSSLQSSPGNYKTPSKRRRRIATPSSSSSSDESTQSKDGADGSDSDVKVIRFEAETVETGGEDESPRRPKRRRTANRFDENEAEDDEEHLGIPVRWKGKGKMKVVDTDDDSSQPRRKLIKGVRPPTPEDDDDSVDETQVLESRLRTRGQQTKYQKSLQKIKNLKSRKRSQGVLQSSEKSSEAASDSDDSEGADDDRSNTTNSDDDDFIVEDNAEGTHSINLPVAFSMNTHQDLTHHFKIICQLFVHMAVRPLPERRPFMKHVLKKEEYFSVPLQVTRRKLSGMCDSLVASSVWSPEFRKTLEKYPELALIRMNDSFPGCHACRLGGRSSTILALLSGAPYDECDFEDLTDEESDSSESHTSAEESNRGSPARPKEFHLGRFCAARTRVYHEFNHWEYSLYMSLQRQITAARDDDNKFVRVAYVGGILPPENLEDADKTMDWLDQRRVIDIEWQKIRKMMDSARNLEISATRGDADDSSP
ncbi:hypothetical protein SCLCIDRAFT_1212467 [Scleroderma citrinum Foug A]|uniref:DUF4211 domain-containing protein n=1 Tax=Scleroderma citrinum Foug A TaxID=1036808 RepID=A0A0C3DXL3_9AGAM|nr:hypothetical protein SCLCIDRAFT_1212467 [Scleroderma citrinum Foug A]